MEVLAYLDAGTGSLILQSVVGALLGIGIFLKAFWGRIIGVFKRGESEDKGQEATSKAQAAPKKTAKTAK